MKKFSKFFVAFVVIFTISQSISAQNPVTVGVALNQLESMLHNTISQLGIEARQTGFSLAQSGTILIENFRLNYSEILNETVDRLNDTQQKAFSNVQSAINNVNTSLEQRLADTRKIVQDVRRVNDEIFLSKKLPQVYLYSPKLVAPTANQEQVIFEIEGANLHHESPFLEFEGKKYPLVGFRDKVTASIPLNELSNSSNKIVFKNIKITFYKKKKCFSKNKETVVYKLPLYLLPNSLAKVQLDKTCQIERELRAKRETGVFAYKSSKSKDQQNFFANVTATEGWKIDIHSLDKKIFHCNRCQWVGFENVNVRGFTMHVQARGSGKHGGGRGAVDVKGIYEEYKNEKINIPETVAKSDIFWGKDASYVVSCDAELKNWTLTIDMFDGTKYIVTDAASSPKDDRLEVLINSNTNQITIRPKNPNVSVIFK